MKLRTTKLLMTMAMIAALGVPSAAQARSGADDGAAHVRHRAGEVHHHKRKHGKKKVRAHVRHRGGADDGPNHR